MKSRETLVRLLRFDIDEKRQKVTDIETMIADFERMATDLDRQIELEQQRAGVSDVNHYAYPTFAKAAIQRRDNLKASVADLTEQLNAAQEELAQAFEELKKVEIIEERGALQERQSRDEAEQKALDETGLSAHLRSAGSSL